MPLYRLIVFKIRMFAARVFRVGGRKKALRIASLAGLSLVFGLFVMGTSGFFGALRALEQGGDLLAALIVAVTFHAILLLAFVLDVATTTNIFFLSSDLPLLMAAPLPTGRVFVLKYLEAMATGSLVALLIAIPVLLGYGVAFGAPVYYYPVMVVVLLIFLSIPISVGTIAGFVIARFARASKVKEVLGLVGGTMGLALWIGFQLIRPSLSNPDQVQDFTEKLRVYAAGGGGLLSLLPSYHAASVLTALRAGSAGAAAAPAMLLAATAAVLFGVSLIAARRLYLAGWARVIPGGKKRKVRKGRPLVESLFFWLPGTERAIVWGTAKLFLRDPQQIMPVATISIMMAVFPFLTARREGADVVYSPVILIALAGLTFVGSMNLGMNGVVIDGRSFWRILLAPVGVKRKLWAKFLLPLTVFVALGWALVLVFKAAGLLLWTLAGYALFVVPCMAAVGSSLGVTIGLYYGNWEWDIPKRMISTTGRLVMAGVLGGFFAATAILMRVLARRGYSDVLHYIASGPRAVGAIVLLLVAALLAYMLIGVAARRLHRMEWKI